MPGVWEISGAAAFFVVFLWNNWRCCCCQKIALLPLPVGGVYYLLIPVLSLSLPNSLDLLGSYLDLLGSVWVLGSWSIWNSVDLLGYSGLPGSVWIFLGLLGSSWIYLEVWGLTWTYLDHSGHLDLDLLETPLILLRSYLDVLGSIWVLGSWSTWNYSDLLGYSGLLSSVGSTWVYWDLLGSTWS